LAGDYVRVLQASRGYLSRLASTGHLTACRHCGTHFHPGNTLVSKQGGHGLRKYYCIRCARRFLIID